MDAAHLLTPGDRLRYLLRHFGLTPIKVNRQSGGRFGRWSLKTWIERGVCPKAETAVAFVEWLKALNRNSVRAGLPSLQEKFLTVEWIWSQAQDDSHGDSIGSDAEKVQRRAS